MSNFVEFLDIEEILKTLKADLNIINKSFSKENISLEIKSYEEQIALPSFWENTDKSPEILKSYNYLKSYFDRVNKINVRYTDLTELYQIALEEQDMDLLSNCLVEAKNLQKSISLEKINSLFDKEEHKNNAYLEIHAGSGGVDAQDFASILLRMYTRWAEKNNFSIKEVDITRSEIAGIKSVTIKIEGLYAYGNLLSEQGVHRLVRISPFNSEGKRQTGFCAVSVYPEVSQSAEIKIENKDLRIDTYRSTGAGGQHVNTTDSAVRITHIPSGLVAQSQAERSQHRNKDMAMNMLLSKLNQLEETKKRESQKNNYISQKNIDFGSQIRSYILNPYSMVKDHRTNLESYNPKDVFDGELKDFILSYLVFIKN